TYCTTCAGYLFVVFWAISAKQTGHSVQPTKISTASRVARPRPYLRELPTQPKHPGASQVGPSTKYLSYRHIHGRLTQPSSSPLAACWSIKRQTSSSQPPTPFFFFVPFFSFSSVFAKCSSLCNCISAKVFRSSGNKG